MGCKRSLHARPEIVLTTRLANLFGSPNDFERPPIVNCPAHKNLLSRALAAQRSRGSRVRLERAHFKVFTSSRLVVGHCVGVWCGDATLLHGSLTIGGKEYRSGARMNTQAAAVNASEPVVQGS